jgi:ribonuclease D
VSSGPSSARDILYLESQDGFDRFMATLAGIPLLAVDTEAASFHRYKDRIYLVQLSTRDATAVVDPLAVTDLSALGRLLQDRSVEVIFHDADYDLRILSRDYGFSATNLFDTRIAAQLLNEPGIGLAALLEKYFGITLDKKFQRADWSMRPLAPGMLEYAAGDTRDLAQLRDILKEQLITTGRWSWAEEEFELLEQTRWGQSGPPEEAYLRIKGAKILRGHQLAVLRELYAWRESAASQLDRAPFRVLMNEAMVSIAKAMPADETALKELKALSPDQLRRRGPELLDAVARGVRAPADSIPVFERTRRPPPDLAYEARLERLKAVRNATAERIPLAPGVLCANGILEAIARMEPKSVGELAGIEGMRRWQREVLGAELVEASLKKSA